MLIHSCPKERLTMRSIQMHSQRIKHSHYKNRCWESTTTRVFTGQQPLNDKPTNLVESIDVGLDGGHLIHQIHVRTVVAVLYIRPKYTHSTKDYGLRIQSADLDYGSR